MIPLSGYPASNSLYRDATSVALREREREIHCFHDGSIIILLIYHPRTPSPKRTQVPAPMCAPTPAHAHPQAHTRAPTSARTCRRTHIHAHSHSALTHEHTRVRTCSPHIRTHTRPHIRTYALAYTHAHIIYIYIIQILSVCLSVCVCVSVKYRRPNCWTDHDQIWHAYADRPGNGSYQKLAP